MRRVALSLCLSALFAAVAGCSAPYASSMHPAVATVEELLALRRADVRDAAAYEPYFSSPEIAAMLARPNEVPTGTPRVPPCEASYLVGETSSSADVAVIWGQDEDFPSWTPVTIFSLALRDGRWVVLDARETSAAPEPLEGAAVRR